MSEHGYNVITPASGGVIKAWTRGVPIEDEAVQQLANVAALPFIHKWVAAMPDVHWGRGATVGSVIATKKAIIPAAVGVDIGCGMVAARTNLTASDLPESLKDLRLEIEKQVPHGRTNNGGKGDRGAWFNLPEDVTAHWSRLEGQFRVILEKHPKIGSHNSANHLSTLGTGNHFIEVCLDESQAVWIMLHSGSRGVGNRIGTYFIEKAKHDMRRWFINLPDEDLAYLPEGSESFSDYWNALKWAQAFAFSNRELMLGRVTYALAVVVDRVVTCTTEIVNCHHNYVNVENHFGENVYVTRKGAVRAREGDLGIIPGSMGVRSYIVRGKGNPDSFHSCSHGAGRTMSRNQARKTITLEDHCKAVAGVECRLDPDVIDESPAAYKDIDAVMAAQHDLVDVVHSLKQILCVKG